MTRREISCEGKDVATAIMKGLNELGRRRDQVEVTVIQEEKSGFLGLGGRPAKVRIMEKKWDAEHSAPSAARAGARGNADYGAAGTPAGKRRSLGKRDFKRTARKSSSYRGAREERARGVDRERVPRENEPQKLPSQSIQKAVIPDYMKATLEQAKQTLSETLGLMGVKVENLNSWWDAAQERVLLTFDCESPSLVIGKDGKTLEAIQYIITLVISRHFDRPVSVVADTQNYWRRLEDKINSEIEGAVSFVKRTKKDYRFRPMSAQMRRYVHRYAACAEGVGTISEGDGKWRKVVLKPVDRIPADALAREAEIAVETITDNAAAKEAAHSAAPVEPSAEQTPAQSQLTSLKDALPPNV